MHLNLEPQLWVPHRARQERWDAVGIENAANHVGLDFRTYRGRAVEGDHVELMRGIEEVLAELLSGILRHRFRISQNVKGAPLGEASAEASRMSQEQQNHNEEEGFDFGNNVAWFLTGAFIGAAVAILYAPKSGKETRQFLADKVQQSKDAVAESSNNIVEASKDMFERGRQLVDDAADLFERGRKLVKG